MSGGKRKREHKPLFLFPLCCISTVLCLLSAKMHSDTSGMCILNLKSSFNSQNSTSQKQSFPGKHRMIAKHGNTTETQFAVKNMMGITWVCETFHEKKRQFNISSGNSSLKLQKQQLGKGIINKIRAGLRMLWNRLLFCYFCCYEVGEATNDDYTMHTTDSPDNILNTQYDLCSWCLGKGIKTHSNYISDI